MLDDRYIQQCAYVVNEEIARRHIANIPVPPAMLELARVLAGEISMHRLRQQWRREMSGSGHEAGQIPPTAGRLESTSDAAQRLGISDRSVRRRAAAAGVTKVGGRYVLRPEQAEGTHDDHRHRR